MKYTFCRVELDQVEKITYMGIMLTSKLKWDQHVSTVSTKASKVFGVVWRNLHNCLRSVRETACKTFVRPTLEYGSAAWDSYYEKDIQKLERVQRKAARFCAGNYKPYASVTEMLHELNVANPSNWKENCKLSLNLTYFSVEANLKLNSERRTRGSHAFKFVVPRTKKIYFYVFSLPTINE